MELRNLKEFERGWIVGTFLPRVLKLDVELGIHKYTKGELRPKHFHKKHRELNVVLSGKCEIIFHGENEVSLIATEDTIFIIDPKEVTSFRAIEDCVIVCLKTGSDPSDKYLV